MASTTNKISLDFYNNNHIIINAKQLDTMSRFINVTCTDHGKKVTLDSNTTSAFIRYKKSDDKEVFNDAIIESDGTATIELTQQMLVSPGKQKVDLVIAAANGLTVDSLEDVQSVYDLNVAIISTMSFYINVIEDVIESSNISSTDEFNALMEGISRLVATEKRIDDIANQATDTVEALDACKSATSSANSAAKNANSAASSANSAADNANSAANNANTAADNANSAANNVKTINQASSTTNAEYPLLFANSTNPSNGNLSGTYFNTGLTINPSKKSITIGSAVLTYDTTNDEKKLIISFN